MVQLVKVRDNKIGLPINRARKGDYKNCALRLFAARAETVGTLQARTTGGSVVHLLQEKLSSRSSTDGPSKTAIDKLWIDQLLLGNF